MAITYYGRMRCIIQLLPLLLAAPTPAHIVTIFNPFFESNLKIEDLSHRDPKSFGFIYGASHMTLMTTFYLENLADRYRGKLASSHYYPGIIMTDGANKGELLSWARWLWNYLLGPVFSFWQVFGSECGERVLFHASERFPPQEKEESSVPIKMGAVEAAVGSNGSVGRGAYKTNWNRKSILSGKPYEDAQKMGAYERVWEHTMRSFGEFEAGRVFVN